MAVEIDIAEGIEHALELLSGGDQQVRPLAGATDAVLRLHAGRLKARRLVCVADVPELRGIRREEDGFRFGAATTVSQLLRHPQVGRELPVLAQAARQFASPQIRNRATLGGNLGNASPAADLSPPLIALGAVATVRSRRGARTLPVEELFLGFGKTALAADELICELFVPHAPGTYQAFAKFGSRGANVIAVVNMALCLKLAAGRIQSARVAYGSVAPKPHRASKVERHLAGAALEPALVASVAPVVLSDISPIDDVRGSKRHKERLAVGATQRALEEALEEAGR